LLSAATASEGQHKDKSFSQEPVPRAVYTSTGQPVSADIGQVEFQPDVVLKTPENWQNERRQQEIVSNILQRLSSTAESDQTPKVPQTSPVLDQTVRKLHKITFGTDQALQDPATPGQKRVGTHVELSSEDDTSPNKPSSKKSKASDT
jgi:hypothetical protein